MGLFRKDKVVDLSEGYHQQKRFASRTVQTPEKSSAVADGFGFFGSIANTVSKEKDDSGVDDNSDSEEKRRKLAKRLADLTNKIEELSNQIYHLQQRVEVLEKKNNINY